MVFAFVFWVGVVALEPSDKFHLYRGSLGTTSHCNRDAGGIKAGCLLVVCLIASGSEPGGDEHMMGFVLEYLLPALDDVTPLALSPIDPADLVEAGDAARLDLETRLELGYCGPGLTSFGGSEACTEVLSSFLTLAASASLGEG